jgi:serine/threonine-protein kinase RsbT
LADEIKVAIMSDADMLPARAKGRGLALELGFSKTDATLIATAISEVVRNIIVHVGEGEVILSPLRENDRVGIVVVARDSGPGIKDVELAMRDGYGSKGGMGLGLPGMRRLMDDFRIDSQLGRGTTVTMKKWNSHGSVE